VAYTGTHDNPTSLGWLKTARFEDVTLAMEYLGLGNSARMNEPSTTGGSNWRWRVGSEALSGELAKKIAHLTRIYGR
jgi:4-alpha-glucanotransferase